MVEVVIVTGQDFIHFPVCLLGHVATYQLAADFFCLVHQSVFT